MVSKQRKMLHEEDTVSSALLRTRAKEDTFFGIQINKWVAKNDENGW